jgi:hypothetical protein
MAWKPIGQMETGTKNVELKDTDLSTRALNIAYEFDCLDIESLSFKTEKEFRRHPGCGVLTIGEFKRVLEKHGYYMSYDEKELRVGNAPEGYCLRISKNP